MLRPVSWASSVLCLRPVVYVGKISYALYLWHFVVFHALTAEALGVGRGPSILVRLTVTFALAAFSYHVIERRFLRRRGDRRPTAVAA